MQSLIKTCALPLAILSLTACGGGGGGSKPAPASSSIAASSIAPASSAAAVSSAAVSSVATLSESTQAAASYTGFSVAKIDNCGVGVSAVAKRFKLFADYDGGVQNQSLSSLNFSGWNHSNNENKGRAEWAKLNVSNHATYDFATSAKVNDSCNGVDTINMVLVKKIADWDFQHSNGFEKNITADGIEFGDIENIIIDLKINSAKTFLPSIDSLKSTYANHVSGDAIDEIESGKVNIGMVIYDGKTEPVLDAKRIIQLDQSLLADQWVRLTIPMKDLQFCSNASYYCTPKTLADLSNKVIAGIQFIGETKTGAVLRSKITEANWKSSTPPEAFKEIDISVKKIEFQLK